MLVSTDNVIVSISTISSNVGTCLSVGQVELDFVDVPSCSAFNSVELSILFASNPLKLGSGTTSISRKFSCNSEFVGRSLRLRLRMDFIKESYSLDGAILRRISISSNYSCTIWQSVGFVWSICTPSSKPW